ncbi:unnamed protein product [Closterium sp. Naga37s-1]|nr:unnamed protein product [Closterium sp. Naga37s-1]
MIRAPWFTVTNLLKALDARRAGARPRGTGKSRALAERGAELFDRAMRVVVYSGGCHVRDVRKMAEQVAEGEEEGKKEKDGHDSGSVSGVEQNKRVGEEKGASSSSSSSTTSSPPRFHIPASYDLAAHRLARATNASLASTRALVATLATAARLNPLADPHTAAIRATAATLSLPIVTLPAHPAVCALLDDPAALLNKVPAGVVESEGWERWRWHVKVAMDTVHVVRQCVHTGARMVLLLQDDVVPAWQWDVGLERFVAVDLPRLVGARGGEEEEERERKRGGDAKQKEEQGREEEKEQEGNNGRLGGAESGNKGRGLRTSYPSWDVLSLYYPQTYGWKLAHGAEYPVPCCAQALLLNASTVDGLLGHVEAGLMHAPLDLLIHEYLLSGAVRGNGGDGSGGGGKGGGLGDSEGGGAGEGRRPRAYVHIPSLFQHIGFVRTNALKGNQGHSDKREEDYYQDSEEEEQVDDSDDDEDYGFDDPDVDDDDPVLRPRQVRYKILSEKDILQRQQEATGDVATVLSIPMDDAAILLRHFKWSVSQVNDEWFQDEDRVRKAVGLPRPHSPSSSSASDRRPGKEPEPHLTCGICFESYPQAAMKPAECFDHFFCDACWQGYAKAAVADGPGCLCLRCPDPSCGAAVGEKLVLASLPDALRAKYLKYLLRSYVDDNRNAKWCPAPGCEYAVEYLPDSTHYDVICKCSFAFCWNCLEEAHRPVDCETVGKWILKNSAESENMNWILANSKSCPKCKRPIEKNQGCMHMTCTPPCKYEFCWLCLGAWSEHGEKTGGFYACNRYESAKHEGVYDETERRREMAKNSLEKYTHYYERWAANEQSRVKALESLREMQTVKIEQLSERHSQPVSQLKFVIDAWLQVVECRRVLKWTYAYGYYLPEAEVARRQFFEYLQGEADAALENLHKMAEKELELYICDDGDPPPTSFNDFRSRLAGLTSVTHTYFENLVRALENGLADVENASTAASSTRAAAAAAAAAAGRAIASTSRISQSRFGARTRSRTTAASAATASTSAAGSSAAGPSGSSAGAAAVGGGSGAGSSRGSIFRSSSSQAAAAAAAAAVTVGNTGGRDREETAYWSCEHCTYANPLPGRACAMCHLPLSTQ